MLKRKARIQYGYFIYEEDDAGKTTRRMLFCGISLLDLDERIEGGVFLVLGPTDYYFWSIGGSEDFFLKRVH